jgi:hypothetical protein
MWMILCLIRSSYSNLTCKCHQDNKTGTGSHQGSNGRDHLDQTKGGFGVDRLSLSLRLRDGLDMFAEFEPSPS